MKLIGLTGNIGTGKSTVARIFEVLGIHVYHADYQARLILETSDVVEKIAFLFGNQAIDAGLKVNRKALAEIVFNDKNKLETLNNLIHPLVEQDFSNWQKQYQAEKYVIHEAAILFESGFNRLFDANILVTAPEELCMARVMQRDSVTKEMVQSRINHQLLQERKMSLADFQIINDGKEMIIPQVLKVHQKIFNL
ncbi:MAG: dephospho-CoA kinase [Bacteroidales bacterium]